MVEIFKGIEHLGTNKEGKQRVKIEKDFVDNNPVAKAMLGIVDTKKVEQGDDYYIFEVST